MSTNQSSELSADLDSRTRVSESTEPFKLGQIALPSIKKGKKAAAKPLIVSTQFPLLKQQLESLGEVMPIEGEDIGLTRIENMGVKGSRKDVVTLVSRTKQRNRLNGQVGEYLVYYTQTEAIDKHHKPLTCYLQHGVDYQVELTSQYDEDGEEIEPIIGQRYQVYTIPYSKETLEKILTDNPVHERCQYNVDIDNQSYGGYTAEELECDIKELQSRGKLGYSGSDLSVKFSELSLKDTLFLAQQRPKP